MMRTDARFPLLAAGSCLYSVLARARRHVGLPVWIAGQILEFAASLAIWSALALAVSAAPPDQSPAVRDVAIQSIPFKELTDETQTKLWSVISKATLHRRLPVQVIDCDPDLYLLFVRKPEVVVNMWQLMGISTLTMKRTGAYTLDAVDGSGTQSKVELVYGTPETHVLYGEGSYEGPLLKRRINGRCVMVLKSGYDKTQLQRSIITNQLDVFLQLENVGADLVAKTLQPLLGKTADQNFAETAAFVSRVSQAIEKNGSGVPRLASRMSNVQPEVRNELVRVANAVSHKNAPPAGSIVPPRDEEFVNATNAGGLLAPVKRPSSSEPVLQGSPSARR